MDSKIKNYLDRLAGSPKRPNSFLFSGTDAEEKIEAAFYFVQKISGKIADGEFLERIKQGIHPDVVVLEPETVEDKKGRTREKEIVIEQVREARHRLKYFPYELREKFCVIKKAERMNPESSNALLKILEEPTASTFFILLADDAESVLPTISSRCAVLRFPETNLPGWNEENRERFRNIFKEEIFEKFDYIEKISRDKNELAGIFKDWEAVAAEGLRKLVGGEMGERGEKGGMGAKGKVEKVVGLIGEIREAINQLERTNASPRAVGEKLMLEMSSG
jgi:DNA polymerase III delta prime subunit